MHGDVTIHTWGPELAPLQDYLFLRSGFLHSDRVFLLIRPVEV